MDNIALRQRIRKQRRTLSHAQRKHSSSLASLHLPKLAKLLPKNANIGLYLDDFGELPTAPILKFCQKHGFMPYLPITAKNKPLTFAPCFYDLGKTPLKRHALGMKEPFYKNIIKINQLDCIICPLVAVDKQGNRLGMGGGFYDRTFTTFKGLKVGWCYDFQVVERLAVNDWDKGVDIVISDGGVIRVG
ncbi:5-formyltetrahydrofolate cyclo-ligase [Moraxella nasibovis]|uniref:5-formyltetrahydrofolate cyclo-ligase n=1 Tax=Moraxella nasibovis TaxID=2904120 RepID=UPI002410B312|nr:5-formyltetrahydrofolate cyclo-ligase [Moraxella nasibovis]WFF39510.1 5-formyltetrahydrofolate cyclo-ligase [Moraxella nasibovis]